MNDALHSAERLEGVNVPHRNIHWLNVRVCEGYGTAVAPTPGFALREQHNNDAQQCSKTEDHILMGCGYG